jgi:Predicted integral membrane protein (DUF2269)
MLYKIALFLHVTGALLVCAALTIEWLCIINTRKANTTERIRESLFFYSKTGVFGDTGALLILLTGIYMMSVAWHTAPWGIAGLLDLMLIGAIGGIVTGRKMKKIRNLLKTNDDNFQELVKLLKGNSLWFSIKMRTAILLGVIFLMTVKPGLAGSILTLVIATALGVFPLRMRLYPIVTKAINS